VRSKNSKTPDALESAYMADVKRVPCVVCNVPAPSDGHHPEQELHFCLIALCKDCHTGPHGWHGDKSRWRVAKMTVLRAINETRRRVEQLRAGVLQETTSLADVALIGKSVRAIRSALSSSKIFPHRWSNG